MPRITLIVFLFISLTANCQDSLIFRDGKKLLFKPLLNDCIAAAKKSSPNSNANVYCDCMLHLAAEHFTLGEMNRIMTLSKVDASMSLMERLKKEAPNEFYACIKASASSVNEKWTKDGEIVFIKGCMNSLPKDKNWQSKYDGKKYCECFLEKVENKYSDQELLNLKSNPELKAIANDCLNNSIKLSQTNKDSLSYYYYNTYLFQTCSDMNRNFPSFIDKDTRMDNALYTSVDTTINFSLTLVNLSKSDIDIQLLKQKLVQSLINKSKDNPAYNDFKEMNVHFSYTYYDKNNNYMFEIKLPDE